MIIRENHCVGCQDDAPQCYSCKYNNVEVHYCDECRNNEADYQISDWQYKKCDICENCFEHYLTEQFENDLSVLEKADMLGINITMKYK